MGFAGLGQTLLRNNRTLRTNINPTFGGQNKAFSMPNGEKKEILSAYEQAKLDKLLAAAEKKRLTKTLMYFLFLSVLFGFGFWKMYLFLN